MTFADLFINEPPQWGLRGDSYLWNELKADLSIYPLPADNSELKEVLAREFLKRTGHHLHEAKDFIVERFLHSGMSNGFISGEFWRETVITQLEQNLVNLAENESRTMTSIANNYILAKQLNWAQNQRLKLIGSQGNRGRKMYTPSLEQNLFEPLDTKASTQFMAGDGGEIPIHPKEGIPGKMNAVHSSSALGANIFHYWASRKLVPDIAAACGLCKVSPTAPKILKFEEKMPIDGIRATRCPNIDVVMYDREDNPTRIFAVECKFTEAYGGRNHPGLTQTYLNCNYDDLWTGIPSLRKIAESIVGEDKLYHHLHPAQLIKHILGCRSKLKDPKGIYRLLYLWYDALGEAGARHRREIETFSQACKSDGVCFHSLTYQELIARLSEQHRKQHPEYVAYITERYL